MIKLSSLKKIKDFAINFLVIIGVVVIVLKINLQGSKKEN